MLNINKDKELKEKDISLLSELENQLNKIKMEKDARNVFNGFSTNNAFDKILEEDKKNEQTEKPKIFEEKNDTLNEDEDKGILNKIDDLLGGKAKKLINITNETLNNKIKDMKLKEKIRKILLHFFFSYFFLN